MSSNKMKTHLVDTARRRRYLLTADVVIPHGEYDVENISETGAFVRTRGPLTVGQRLDLTIELEDEPVTVRAEVVRVQEPSWRCPGGVGVRFSDCSEEVLKALKRFIEAEGSLYSVGSGTDEPSP